jgi:hypothetical protein
LSLFAGPHLFILGATRTMFTDCSVLVLLFIPVLNCRCRQCLFSGADRGCSLADLRA